MYLTSSSTVTETTFLLENGADNYTNGMQTSFANSTDTMQYGFAALGNPTCIISRTSSKANLNVRYVYDSCGKSTVTRNEELAKLDP